MVKNCDLGLENAALGLRPRAVFSRPRSQFFTIRTSQPANNIYLFDILSSNKSSSLRNWIRVKMHWPPEENWKHNFRITKRGKYSLPFEMLATIWKKAKLSRNFETDSLMKLNSKLMNCIFAPNYTKLIDEWMML